MHYHPSSYICFEQNEKQIAMLDFDNIKDAVLSIGSKEEVQALADWMGNDPEKFADLWNCIVSKDHPRYWRSAWVMDKLTAKYPQLLLSYREKLVQQLEIDHAPGVYRAVLKAIVRNPIPEAVQGFLFDYAIKHLLNPQSSAAIQAHSMTIAYEIAKDIPELKEELRAVITDQAEYNTAAYQSRARQILKKMDIINIKI